MSYRFNPPPNWPPPPPGWSPQPGWQPDPTWPPPPPGWNFWIPDDDTAPPSPTGPMPPPPPDMRRPQARPAAHPLSRQPDASPGTPAQSIPQRVRVWFRRLPTWAKILVVLLVVGLLPWLLIAAGIGIAGLGIVGLLRGPLPRFKITSRASAVGAVVLGVVGIGAGGALAVAVLSPPPPSDRASPPIVAPATQPAPPTVTSMTAVPRTTAHPATTRSPTTVTTKKPAAIRPPKSSSPPSTAKPASLCGAPPNPYGYNFCGRGGYVLDPPPDICAYFDCIPNFWNGQGHMEECRDHTYSMSGGRSGSCSYHGGNLRAVSRGP